MRIDLKIDSAPLVLRLQNGQRRLAYAVVDAINNTAKRIQTAERVRRMPAGSVIASIRVDRKQGCVGEAVSADGARGARS